jgi:hypothetical protein
MVSLLVILVAETISSFGGIVGWLQRKSDPIAASTAL